MKNKIRQFSEKIMEFTNKNSPSLLTGASVAGVFFTAWMSYKAAPKANEIIERHSMAVQNGANKKTETGLLVKELAPVVLPPIGMATATSIAIIGANTISSKRIAVLSAAYSMSETALKEYEEKAKELFDEKKVRKIKDNIAQDKLDKKNFDTSSISDADILMSNGDCWCMDSYSGRLFRSNAQKIGQAINEISADVQTDMYVSLNDFYDRLGLEPVRMGDDFGWNVDDLVRGQLTIDISACLTKDKQPCLVVDYDVQPREDFRHLH